MALRYIFFEHLRQTKGFYVDVGAHHPTRFSNTYFFYLNGWRGINIEPTPGTSRLFNRYRPRDKNLEIGIATVKSRRTFFMFNESALNTFDESNAIRTLESTSYSLISKQDIQVKPLSEVLSDHLSESQEIDFLSIDAEGSDVDVLHSNDWHRYRPKVVLFEDNGVAKGEDERLASGYDLLSLNGYRLWARTSRTAICLLSSLFVRNDNEG